MLKELQQKNLRPALFNYLSAHNARLLKCDYGSTFLDSGYPFCDSSYPLCYSSYLPPSRL